MHNNILYALEVKIFTKSYKMFKPQMFYSKGNIYFLNSICHFMFNNKKENLKGICHLACNCFHG